MREVQAQRPQPPAAPAFFAVPHSQIEKLRPIIMKPLEDNAACIIKSQGDFEEHQQWLTDNLDEKQMRLFTELMTKNSLSDNDETAKESNNNGPGQSH